MDKVIVVLFVLVLAGCAPHSKYDRDYVSKSIANRTGHPLDEASKAGQIHLPEDVSLKDGLSEDEAIAIALWNNPKFQMDLTELGFARADLKEAGLLRNPILSLLFPVGPKQLEATLTFPIDVLWQRPKRVAAAKVDVERVSQNLLQNGLDLAREVLIAYADLILAEKRLELVQENEKLKQEIANISAARLRLGDISELEESSSRLEALRAEDNEVRRRQELDIAKARFRSLLGLEVEDTSLQLAPVPETEPLSRPLPELFKESFAARPDLRAAELGIEAAGKRIGLEQSKIFNLTGVLDANAQGKEGFEMGPGIQVELPILNWNEGRISRSKAQLEQAVRQYFLVKQRIALEVVEANTNFLAAKDALTMSQSRWVPEASEAATRAKKAYEAGEVSYLSILEISSQLIDARLREAESTADLNRAIANLKHSIGFYQAKQPDDYKPNSQ